MVILIPDFKGEALARRGEPGSFFANLLELYPNAVAIPVLNGGDYRTLLRQAKENTTDQLRPLVSEQPARRVVGALITGYEYILDHYPDQPIIRLDTAEHDPVYISQMIKQAEKIRGLVIGQLDFTHQGLVEGTYDYWIHTQVFPEFYSGMTNGKLRLSCAHGFLAFAPGVVARLLPKAKAIVAGIEEARGESLTWGFDGALAIAAYSEQLPTCMIPIPAQSVRNRGIEKINGQLHQHMEMLKMALKLDLI